MIYCNFVKVTPAGVSIGVCSVALHAIKEADKTEKATVQNTVRNRFDFRTVKVLSEVHRM